MKSSQRDSGQPRGTEYTATCVSGVLLMVFSIIHGPSLATLFQRELEENGESTQ